MGLDIEGSVSKKNYCQGYHGLHSVRWLALLNCGLPREVNGEQTHSWATGPWLHGFVREGKELPTIEQMQTILWAFQLSGYHYPNLMFHSDCEGSYTKSGKVFKTKDLMSGNSLGLLKELKILKEDIPEDMRESRAVGVFNMLYELVYDEVKNGKGIIKFS